MSITKKQFKALLKECLIEIIHEGVFDSILEENRKLNKEVRSSIANSKLEQQSLLSEEAEYKQFAKHVAETASNNMGNDALRSKYKEIFEDTMLHTMPKLNSKLNEAAVNVEATRDAERLKQVLGPAADPNKWSQLAFSNKPKVSTVNEEEDFSHIVNRLR